jgi:hypothetical protein
MPLRTSQAAGRQLKARHIGMIAMLRGRGLPPGLLTELWLSKRFAFQLVRCEFFSLQVVKSERVLIRDCGLNSAY